jgi:hypothetical protein
MIAVSTAVGCSAEIGDESVAEGASEEALGSTAEALSDGVYAWVWANDATSASYTPNSNYSFNSENGTNKVVKLGTGQYRVEFPSLGAAANGNVQVSAYGSGNARCKVQSWVPSGSQLNVNVRCHTPSGALTNTQFVTWYHRASSEDFGAYVWADQPTTASYTANSGYSWNSKGGTNTIQREGKGLYAVNLAKFTATGGNVLVTAYGADAQHCKVRGWDSNASATVARVACFDSTGSATDTLFSLSYVGSIAAPDNWGAYVWANNTSASAYDPDPTYRHTSSNWLAGISEPQARPSAGRIASGSYYVHYPYMPHSNKTVALATAYGTSSDYCKVSSWSENEGDSDDHQGARVFVRCFDSAGNAKDGRFTQRYAFHSFLIF